MRDLTADEASKTMPEPSEQPAARQNRIKSADTVKTRFRHALQLQTVEDGYNSGRTYYLQASSDERCKTVCDSIARHARRARRAADAQSRLRRAQRVVLAVYESAPFQSAIAVLILAVRAPRARERGACAPDRSGRSVCAHMERESERESEREREGERERERGPCSASRPCPVD